jgi:hypothetical protein
MMLATSLNMLATNRGLPLQWRMQCSARIGTTGPFTGEHARHNCAARRSFTGMNRESSVPAPCVGRQLEQTPGGAELRRRHLPPRRSSLFFTFLHTDDGDGRNLGRAEPIIDPMLPTWTFDREGEQLIVQRDTRDGESCALIVTRDGVSRRIDFPELPALVRFQTDMDTFLLRTGWLLLTYAPDRRRRDRRQFPRVSNDRRRWWTDGAEPETGPTGKERRRREAK